MVTETSPVRLEARLDGELSRGLWLIKWLLLVPHLIVLAFLWLAFTVLSMVAFVAILITARYPRSIFEFNLGVMRWTWRVWFYGYGAFGTDRYPSFSLGEEPDYPATLDMPYPERLSRGLLLVKWWLLALPHYLVVAFFVGGGGFLLWQWGERWSGPSGGLVSLLVLFAGVALLFTGRYPRGIFDVVMGMNRWVFRVGAYVALMTDSYPPFRMDTGGPESPNPEEDAGQPPPHAEPPGANGWTTGRVISVVVGSLLLLTGLGATAGGGTLLWADSTQRDSARYLTTSTERFTDPGYALRFDAADVIRRDVNWPGDVDWLGEVRVRVSRVDDGLLFVGIARTDDLARYLDAVPHGRFSGNGTRGMLAHMAIASTRPPSVPAEQGFWVASTSGAGPLSVNWDPQPGRWSLVVMNFDASRGVRADVDFGATVPALRPVVFSVLGVGVALLIGGALLVGFAARSRRALP